jgi:hypothetical protein
VFDEGVPGENPNKGWNRASIQFKSRRPYKPNLTLDDLMMPNGLGTLRMLRTCVLMAGMMTVLYVWIPLWFLVTWVPISDLTYALTLSLAFIAISCILYLGGSRGTRRERELARRM